MLSISCAYGSDRPSRILRHKVFNNLRGINIHAPCFLSSTSALTFLACYCRLARDFCRGWLLVACLKWISSKRRCDRHRLVTWSAKVVWVGLSATTAGDVALVLMACRLTARHAIHLILVSRVYLGLHGNLTGLDDSRLLGGHVLR